MPFRRRVHEDGRSRVSDKEAETARLTTPSRARFPPPPGPGRGPSGPTERDREVAQLAATLGREFSYERCRRRRVGRRADVAGELAKLVQAEILSPEGQAAQVQLHVQTRPYRSRRVTIARQGQTATIPPTIAQVAGRGSANHRHAAGLLAHHFSEAALADKSIGCWLRAGQRSIGRSANVEAIGHLTRD